MEEGGREGGREGERDSVICYWQVPTCIHHTDIAGKKHFMYTNVCVLLKLYYGVLDVFS